MAIVKSTTIHSTGATMFMQFAGRTPTGDLRTRPRQIVTGRSIFAAQDEDRKKVDRRQLLALPKGGDRVFPAFQFHQGDVVAGFSEVLEALHTESPFVALSFLLSRSRDFGDKTAIEALRAGKIEEVVLEARGFLKHGS